MKKNNKFFNLIQVEEENSFNRMISSNKLNKNDFIADSLEFYTSILQARKEYFESYLNLSEEEINNRFAEETWSIDKICDTNSFLEYYRETRKFYKTFLNEKIIEIYKRNYNFGQYGNRVKKNFLNSIQFLTTFDHDLDQNAFLEELNRNKIYAIKNNHVFDSYITTFIVPFIINSSVSINGKPLIFNPKEIADLFLLSAENFKTTKFNLTFLEDNNHNGLFCSTNTVNQLFGRDLYYGIQFFSFLHEYGHIIFNHFENQKSNFENELDADIFATNCLTFIANSLAPNKEKNGDYATLIEAIYLISPLILIATRIAFSKNRNECENFLSRYLILRQIIEKNVIINDQLFRTNLKTLFSQLNSNIEDLIFELCEKMGFEMKGLLVKYETIVEELYKNKIELKYFDRFHSFSISLKDCTYSKVN